MTGPKLEEICKPTEDDIERARQHPEYLKAIKRLKEAGTEFPSLAHDEGYMKRARDSVARQIREQLRPLHQHGPEHITADIETEIWETWGAQVQALRDVGYDPFSDRPTQIKTPIRYKALVAKVAVAAYALSLFFGNTASAEEDYKLKK